jgi:26S proteasome regulatory subunit N8
MERPPPADAADRKKVVGSSGDDKKDAPASGGLVVPAVAHSGAAEAVVVHPLVLLSVTDHFYRVAKDSRDKRVVGVILGESFQGRVDVTNSFAVPFEEDAKDPKVFFLDHDYLETMAIMFKKVGG